MAIPASTGIAMDRKTARNIPHEKTRNASGSSPPPRALPLLGRAVTPIDNPLTSYLRDGGRFSRATYSKVLSLSADMAQDRRTVHCGPGDTLSRWIPWGAGVHDANSCHSLGGSFLSVGMAGCSVAPRSRRSGHRHDRVEALQPRVERLGA